MSVFIEGEERKREDWEMGGFVKPGRFLKIGIMIDAIGGPGCPCRFGLFRIASKEDNIREFIGEIYTWCDVNNKYGVFSLNYMNIYYFYNI
jgi:hypothetical protein